MIHLEILIQENDNILSIHIRIATLADAPNLSFLGKKTFDQSFGHLFRDRNDLLDYLKTTFSEEKLKRSISKKNNIFWIIFYENNVVGYAKIQLNSPSEFIDSDKVCKLQKIYILKDYLSQGIGGDLQKIIFDKVFENNCNYIWLSVLKSNEKAVAFYMRNNYKIVGEHPFSIGKEDFEFWVMSRRL